MADEQTVETVVRGFVERKAINGGEYALVLQIVRGFERGESSHWALDRINAFTPNGIARARLMSAVSQIVTA